LDLGIAEYNEQQRAQAASGERTIANFITDLHSEIQNSKTEMGRQHNAHKGTLLNDFRVALNNSPSVSTSDNGNPVVSGEAARWIRNYYRSLVSLQENIPTPRRFQQMITEQFAINRGSFIGSVTQGTYRQSGILTLHAELEREPGEVGYRVVDIDDHWTLGTGASNPPRVAQNLMDSLNGFPVFTHSGLAKRIHLMVDDQGRETHGYLLVTSSRELFINTDEGSSLTMRSMARHTGLAEQLIEIDSIEGSSR
jgi:hypothetical protein